MFAIGNYRILDKLDKCGLCEPYLCAEPHTGSHVVIGTIRAADHYPSENVDAFRGRLLGDVRAASSLSHPNIVAVYEVGRDGDLDYVVTEYVNGRTLKQIVAEGPPDLPLSLRTLTDVAHALDYAHSQGIVHDRVGTDCILIRDDGFVKVSGFGTARLIYKDTEALAPYPQPASFLLPECPSPEFLKGEYPRTGRSDQFSLATVAYRLVAGRDPFTAEGLASRLAKIVLGEPPPVHSINPAISPQMHPVVRKALSKDPAGRFDTCAQFMQALCGVCEV